MSRALPSLQHVRRRYAHHRAAMSNPLALASIRPSRPPTSARAKSACATLRDTWSSEQKQLQSRAPFRPAQRPQLQSMRPSRNVCTHRTLRRALPNIVHLRHLANTRDPGARPRSLLQRDLATNRVQSRRCPSRLRANEPCRGDSGVLGLASPDLASILRCIGV